MLFKKSFNKGLCFIEKIKRVINSNDSILRICLLLFVILIVVFKTATNLKTENTHVIHWFVPTIDSFNVLVAAATAFLAFGRFKVSNDAVSFWTALGFYSFAVGTFFHFLTFPELIAPGDSILGSRPGTSALINLTSRTFLLVSLLLASGAKWPKYDTFNKPGKYLFFFIYIFALTFMHFALIIFENRIPNILRDNGYINSLVLYFRLCITLVSALGFALALKNYFKKRDPLLGYLALCQVVIIFTLTITMAVNPSRFTIWWYLSVSGWAFGFLIVLFGLLKEYSLLFQKEQEKTRQLAISEAIHKASEHRFRSITENMSEGLMLFDSDINLIYQNPASLRIHGFNEQDRVELGRDELKNIWRAKDKTGRLLNFDEWPVSRVFRHEHFKDEILNVERIATGQKFYGSYNGSPIYDANGSLVLGFITIRDITEQILISRALEESEEKFRAFAEAMPQMAFIADAQGNIVYYNKRHYEFFGVNPGETESWHWKEKGIHHPDDLAKTVEKWKHSLATGEPYEIEYRLRRYDGVYRWHLGRAFSQKNRNGRIVRWFGTNTDIHDQKVVAARLEEAVIARDEFLSIASHELKTPLTALKLQTQLFKKGIDENAPVLDPVRIRKLIEQTDRQANRLNRLVDDMLDIARIRSGNLTIHSEKFDFAELVEEVAERLASALSTSNPVIEFLSVEKIEGVWDRFRIEQVIINLLTNAIKYGNKKPVTICLKKEQNKAVLSVADQGIGISPEAQERIFNRFERAISANEVSGLGLGLFITRQIVEAHHGRIWVESKGQGQGSTFYVELPLFDKKRATREFEHDV